MLVHKNEMNSGHFKHLMWHLKYNSNASWYKNLLYNLLLVHVSLLLVLYIGLRILTTSKAWGCRVWNYVHYMYVIFQDNDTIFGSCMAIWTVNVIAKFHQKSQSGCLKICKIWQGITFLPHPVYLSLRRGRWHWCDWFLAVQRTARDWHTADDQNIVL